MVIVDANVLLYAVDQTAVQHEQSRAWLDRALDGAEAVALAWIALLAFVRLSTNPAVFANPITTDEALDQVEAWTGAPAAVVVQPTPRHSALLRGLLRDTATGGNLTNDAHLVALALEYGADIVSYDRDFGRFAGVRHRLPG